MIEPTPDSDAELANDYLDGTLDAPTRDRVAASADLLAAVDAQRTVRAALGVPPAAALEVRIAALAAAAAAFDASVVPGPERPADGRPTDDLAARRRRRMRRLAATAGAAAAAVIVVVAAFNLGSSSNDLKSSATAPTTAPFSIEAAAPAAAPDGSTTKRHADATTLASGETADSQAADAGPAAKTDHDGAIVSLDEPAGLLTLARRTSTAAGTAAGGATSVASEPGLSTTAPVGPATTTLAAPSITTASDGGAAGSASASAPDGSQCLGPGDVLLANIVYRSAPAVAVVDDRRHVRRALDSTTCAVLAEIAEPS